MTASPQALLDVTDLTIELRSGLPVVQDISLALNRGATLGLVGESGSGKTTVAMTLLGYVRPGMRVVHGQITIAGEGIDLRDEKAARRARGRLVSLVPQDPATSLNPALRIGGTIRDVLEAHTSGHANDVAVGEALDRVHLPITGEFMRRFPHQLSGGQQQRVLIACALACSPPLVVLDEPTTGLDVVTQAQILAQIDQLHSERELAMVYVSHDLAVVSQLADRIAVMYAGRIVEHGPASMVLTRPRHPYTRGLIGSSPDHVTPRQLHGIPGVAVGLGDRPTGCAFAPRCAQRVARCELELPPLEPQQDGRSVRCFEAERTPPLQFGAPLAPATPASAEPILLVRDLKAVHGTRGHTFTAAEDISFAVRRSECLALVGESGSGKSTIARVIVGLHPPAAGEVQLDGRRLAPLAKERSRDERRRCQIVFQNPYESLNPRQKVEEQVARPARLLRGFSRADARAAVTELFERVRLPTRLGEKFPSELSGGERQRVAIARALAAGPAVLICDEVTSALDVSVQAAVLDVLIELQRELELGLVFITHNLGVVATVADSVLVLTRGRICERGSVNEVLHHPSDPITQQLLAAAPRLRATAKRDALVSERA
ncbi:MAG TPA: ABC transporter ATP-binding protein [Solirubrobacteraceae bacterium]|jgi:peptide/nickel transport system ATP-binding protein|nr:ABC transporter ATP-binding protein [Solirubrobacteraceae bacterium]